MKLTVKHAKNQSYEYSYSGSRKDSFDLKDTSHSESYLVHFSTDHEGDFVGDVRVGDYVWFENITLPIARLEISVEGTNHPMLNIYALYTDSHIELFKRVRLDKVYEEFISRNFRPNNRLRTRKSLTDEFIQFVKTEIKDTMYNNLYLSLDAVGSICQSAEFHSVLVPEVCKVRDNNEDRGRFYGHRIGDYVRNALGQHGFVVGLGPVDNNKIKVMIHGQIITEVAEWCDFLITIDKKQYKD